MFLKKTIYVTHNIHSYCLWTQSAVFKIFIISAIILNNYIKNNGIIINYLFIYVPILFILQSISPGKINVENNWSLEKYKESVVMMKPERVASMVVVTLTTPPDIVVSKIRV